MSIDYTRENASYDYNSHELSGPITALAVFALVGDGKGFKNGRHFAAYLGLTPKQHSSGNRECLLASPTSQRNLDSYAHYLTYREATSLLVRYHWRGHDYIHHPSDVLVMTDQSAPSFDACYFGLLTQNNIRVVI